MFCTSRSYVSLVIFFKHSTVYPGILPVWIPQTNASKNPKSATATQIVRTAAMNWPATRGVPRPLWTTVWPACQQVLKVRWFDMCPNICFLFLTFILTLILHSLQRWTIVKEAFCMIFLFRNCYCNLFTVYTRFLSSLANEIWRRLLFLWVLTVSVSYIVGVAFSSAMVAFSALLALFLRLLN